MVVFISLNVNILCTLDLPCTMPQIIGSLSTQPKSHFELNLHLSNIDNIYHWTSDLCKNMWTCPRLKVPLTLKETHKQTEHKHKHTHKETLIIVVPVSTTSTVLLAGLWRRDKSLESMSGKSLLWVLISFSWVCWHYFGSYAKPS